MLRLATVLYFVCPLLFCQSCFYTNYVSVVNLYRLCSKCMGYTTPWISVKLSESHNSISCPITDYDFIKNLGYHAQCGNRASTFNQ